MSASDLFIQEKDQEILILPLPSHGNIIIALKMVDRQILQFHEYVAYVL